MTHRLWPRVAACLLVLCASLLAQPKTNEEEAAKDVAEEKEHKAWYFAGSLEWLSAYVFRGYNNVDTGYILQPSFSITRNFELKDEISLDVNAGAWASFSEDTPGVNSPANFNELDMNLGADLYLGKFVVGLKYNLYTSPANDFDQVQEMGLVARYEHWLTPIVSLYKEFEDKNGSSDWYLELSLEPVVYKNEKFEISIPLYVGTSLDGYYTDSDGHNEFFGYFSGGVWIEYLLSENWKVYGAVEYYQLFADSVEEANSGDDYKIVGRIGVAFEY